MAYLTQARIIRLNAWLASTVLGDTYYNRMLKVDHTAASNVSTNPTDLVVYSLPAGTLAHDGDSIVITAEFSYAANGNSKTSAVSFGGTTIAGRGAAADNGSSVVCRCVVTRTSATTQIAEGLTGVSTTATQLVLFTSPAETLANAINIKLIGTSGTASSDVTSRLLAVEYRPCPSFT